MKKFLVVISLFFLLGALLMLTGCQSDSSSEKADSKTLKVYNFGDYLDPDLVERFEEEYGIKVVIDSFDTNEEMYPVISKGTVKYDVICASDYMIQKLIEEKLLAKLDYDNLPNLKNIEPKYMEIASKFDKNNEYAIPHTWGTLGIIYNTKKIKKGEITSWNDLWNKKYDQQIVMPDSMRDTFAIALKAKGYSLNTKNEKELEEAIRYLEEQKPLVYKYANDSARDLAIGESTDIAVVWNGEVLYSQEENENLEFVIPKEGSEEFMDLWAIPKNAENKTNAEKWMDFMMRRDVALKNYEYLTYSIPNKEVIKSVGEDEEVKKYIFPDEKILERCEPLESLGYKYDDIYNKYWKQFKSK
ncbi:MAG: ABC transporter substrate-binding protein [Eubacterium sp.]|nr:ABC transporter substrate-binding protein [Eubacterium sp.]